MRSKEPTDERCVKAAQGKAVYWTCSEDGPGTGRASPRKYDTVCQITYRRNSTAPARANSGSAMWDREKWASIGERI